MTDHDETLRGLIAKWKELAISHNKNGDSYRVGMGWGLEECAEQLEAALLSPVDRPRGHEQEQADPTRVDADCPECAGTGMRLYGREVSDGCDRCVATGRVPMMEARARDSAIYAELREVLGVLAFDAETMPIQIMKEACTMAKVALDGMLKGFDGKSFREWCDEQWSDGLPQRRPAAREAQRPALAPTVSDGENRKEQPPSTAQETRVDSKAIR